MLPARWGPGWLIVIAMGLLLKRELFFSVDFLFLLLSLWGNVVGPVDYDCGGCVVWVLQPFCRMGLWFLDCARCFFSIDALVVPQIV